MLRVFLLLLLLLFFFFLPFYLHDELNWATKAAAKFSVLVIVLLISISVSGGSNFYKAISQDELR
ncbi:unnamed protein product [Citrullus colocynthis]|uniref:Uncharacterized protein n=1 Tax=Citrullus colocynthis TaxID=252529 RepID=A0ABP0Z2M7_9ROSI